MRTDDKTKRVFIASSNILEGSRVRMDYGDLKALAHSIDTEGLIQPVVVDLNYRLIAGCRRLKAMRDILHWTEIPCVFMEVLDDAQLRRLEAEENVRRKDMTWQEIVRSIKLVHQHQALSAAIKSSTWTQDMTGSLLNMSQAKVSYALQVATLLDANDPEVLKASTLSDAIKLLVRRLEDKVNAAIVQSTIPAQTGGRAVTVEDLLAAAPTGGIYAPEVTIAGRPDVPEAPSGTVAAPITVPLSKMLYHSDCIKWLVEAPGESVDHIITDPPYGIDMDMIQQDGGGKDVSSTAAEHDVALNDSLFANMFQPMYDILRPNGFLILWCDIMRWEDLNTRATAAGFKIQRWPLYWVKTHQCQNMAAQYNFTKNVEAAMVCRKGNATLLTPQSSSYWQGSGTNEASQFGHPFAKPLNLWRWLYGAVAQRGQTVLDPFAGSGSSTIASIMHGLKPIAIESNEAHYNRMFVNVTTAYKSLHPNVQFT